MALSDLLMFENPGIVALAIGLLVFIVAYTILLRMMEKGSSMIIALVFGILAAFYLYRNDFFGWESNVLAFIILLTAVAIILKIVWAFVKHGKRQFGA